MTDTERLNWMIDRQVTVQHYPVGTLGPKYYTLTLQDPGGTTGPYADTPREAIDAAINKQHSRRLPK